ncbi:polysaccharide deacetylase family protein [Alsobacter sp. SYSU BS001988]
MIENFRNFLPKSRGTSASRTRPCILMYHRVGEALSDPWGMVVSPLNFASQMRALRVGRECLTLSEFVARLKAGALKPESIAISFDDGYVDNLTNAMPILKAYDLQATLFLTTGATEKGEPFWWDELTRCFYMGRNTEISDGATGELSKFARGKVVRNERSWRAWDPPRSPNDQAYQQLWRIMKFMPADRRAALLILLRELCQPARSDDLCRAMNSAELAQAAQSGVFSIGGHTVCHPSLPSIKRDLRSFEICEGKKQAERIARKEVEGFSYPYGDFDRTTKNMVSEAGFKWAVTSRFGTVKKVFSDPFLLPRVGVPNISGPELMEMIAQR